jgi:hypothetical protein
MILASSPLSLCWEFVTRHPGLMLVLIGVAGEVACDWKEMTGRLAWAKKISAMLLVIGLAVEFWESAKLDNEVADTKERTALVESNNLVLKKQVLELEAKMQPRRITMEKRTNFMTLAQLIPKIPVKIVIGQEGRDTEAFAKDLRETLTMAGFSANEGAGILGIDRLPSLIHWAELWNTNESDLIFFTFGTNHWSDHWHSSTASLFDQRIGQVIGPRIPIVENKTDNVEIFSAIDYCFVKIGIKTEWVSDGYIVKPGEVLVFVPVR